jgi:hypothetical protein
MGTIHRVAKPHPSPEKPMTQLSVANLKALPVTPEQAVLRHLDAAREQLADARARLGPAHHRVTELESAVANLEDLAAEVIFRNNRAS